MLNNTDIGSGNGFTTWSNFTAASGFTSGVNQLDFVVTNWAQKMAAFFALQTSRPTPGYVLDAQYFYGGSPDSIGNNVVRMDDQFARARYPSSPAKFGKVREFVGLCTDFQRE